MGTSDTNADILAAFIPGVIHAVGIEIIIDGKVFKHFHSFQLQQSILRHHTFTLIIPHDALSRDQQYDMEDARDLLGSTISIIFQYRNIGKTGPDRKFKGIITHVKSIQEYGNKGNIVLTGNSPTILLDAAAHTQSFSDISLQSLAEEIVNQGTDIQQLKMSVRPHYKGTIPYTCQYGETHYNYLCRMAAAYGEWFFYDGDTLHLGKPSYNNAIKLIFGRDAHEISVNIKAAHTNQQYYGYNSNRNEALCAEETQVGYLGELGNFAYKQSQQIFKTPSLQNSPIRAVFDGDITASKSGINGGVAAGLFTVAGSTSIPFLYPGCLIDLNFRKPDSGEAHYFSRMMVTEVNHSLDSVGKYQNQFEAIPSDTNYLPLPYFDQPIAAPQVATVTDNNDAQGRVKIAFPWQTKGETTDYIRVMTPDAGSSQAVDKNRGFVFIPEVGDQVMVGFQHHHPDRPFVMGALFHGAIAAGGFTDNHKKSITTRSGCRIVIDDNDAAGSILIEDPSGNSWRLDGDGNITVQAPKDFTLLAGEQINITAGMGINVTAGMNITESAGLNHTIHAGAMMIQTAVADYNLMAANILEIAQGDRNTQAKEVMEISKNRKIVAQEDSNIHTQKTFSNNSGEQAKHS